MESAGFYVSSSGNFTIDYLLSLLCILSIECQIYIFYVENLLRATKTRVFSPRCRLLGHPDAHTGDHKCAHSLYFVRLVSSLA